MYDKGKFENTRKSWLDTHQAWGQGSKHLSARREQWRNSAL
jgi:hypothetical protein